MLAARIERFFEARYRRAPERHLADIRRFVVGLLIVVVIAVTPLFTSYVEPTPAQLVRTYLVVVAIAGLGGGFVLIPRWRRTHRDVELWLQGDRSPEQTIRAWKSAKNLTWQGVRDGLSIGLVVLWLPGVVYTVIEYDLTLAAATGAFIAITVIAALCVVVGWPIVDEYLRPVRRDLARHVPPTEATASPHAPLAVRFTAFVSVIGLLTGTAVTVVATIGDRSVDQMTTLLVVTVVVGTGAGYVLAFLLARSLLTSLGDLVAVTDDVTHGDLSARALVMSDDEIGVLSMRFNRMLDGLAEALGEVRASRARIVAASDEERKRIERNIHDGAQQQLTALALQLEMLRQRTVTDPEVAEGLAGAMDRLKQIHRELRELAQGLHPTTLATDGLAPALEQLAERASVPATVRATTGRFDAAVEAAAYFVASEALANVAKYAQASSVSIQLEQRDRRVVLEVADDGVGGAHIGEGSGLTGLADRVEAVGGSLTVHSPAGAGTTVRAELPVDPVSTVVGSQAIA